MNGKKVIGAFLPKKLKRFIRKNIGPEAVQTAVYKIQVEDINSLKDKKVIVTGGTGAIGSAICHRLLIEGAAVGVCGRDMGKLNKLIRRFEEEQLPGAGRLIPLVLDVTDEGSIQKAIQEFVDTAGGLDAFINNAGGGARNKSKLIFEQDIEVIDQVLNTNLRGSILCARRAAQIMVEQKHGKIINMSSVVGMCGKETMADYAAAKAGILGFTKALALELGRYNITVNCISPGMVNQIPFDAGMPRRETDTNCLKRFGYTDEVANLVSFILSKEADYITGQNFVIDGGRSLGLMGDK